MTDTMNKNGELFVSNELLGATLTVRMSESDVASFAKDPKSFIASSLNFDTGDVSVLMVENDFGTVNLVLPYYADLERISAESVMDGDIGDIAGGEILISIFAICGVAAGTAIAGTLGAAAIAGTGAATALGMGLIIGGGVVGGVAGVATVATVAAVGGAAGDAATQGKNLNGSDK